ncbi:MAG: HAMP domain-containing histidine kinase [bacterium]|nr:HAMP domain-containing histidine kinase [bacterium]
MRFKFRKIYLLPITIGLILFLGLTFWFYQERKTTKKQTISIMRDEAVVINKALKGIIQSQMRKGRIARMRLKFILDNVVDSKILKYVCIISNRKIIYESNTRPPANLKFPTKSGYKAYNKIFYYWEMEKYNKPPPPPPKKRNQFKFLMEHYYNPENTIDHTYDFRKSTQKIIVGIDAKSFFKQIHEVNSKLALTYLISCIALVILISAWIYFIKNNRLKFELTAIKDRTEKLEELGLASAGLAHEVKNPLGIIRGFAQRISKSEDAGSIREMAYKIIDEADVTTERLSDFMNYAKHRPPVFEKISVQNDFSETLEVFKYDFEDKGIIFETQLDDIIIEADNEFLNQIVINILMNCCNACEPGNKVKLIFKRLGSFACLTIADDGPGIKSNLLNKIYKPYVSGNPKGHGIGLSIVKKLVEESGWSIDIVSEVNKGTIVKIDNIKTC